jgi:uncharacterized protein (DUF885 family)
MGDGKAGDGDRAFDAVAARFLESYLTLFPETATERGDHRFDARWSDLSEAGEAAQRKVIAETKAALAALPPEKLGPEARIDREILDNQLGAWAFGLDELRRAENDPVLYTSLLSDGVDPLVTREFAPIEERMKSLTGRLETIGDVVRAAKARLKHPPKVFTETAIEQNKGLVQLLKAGLADTIAKVPAQKAALDAARVKATATLEELQTFLEKELLPRSDGDFRLGSARFEKKLRFTLADPTAKADDVAKAARALLDESRDGMYATARELWPTVMKKPMPKGEAPADRALLVRAVLARLAEDHPTNKTIVDDATKLLADVTRFVRAEDVVAVPDEPCRVIEMPEYRRGVTIAYCDSSGPLEKKKESFYAISPTPKDWPKERAASFYREYNASMLANLTVHEAMPGHYLQAMHANHFQSPIRAVFDDGSFVEGWAVYAEWLMAQHGYGGAKVRMMRQKMAARVASNAILDFGIHAGNMSEEEAIRLMMNDAYQEEGEAVAKWKRARLTSTQLSTYAYGYLEMRRFRAEAEKAKDFKERAYHDALLAHGSPPLHALHPVLFPDGH